MNKDARPLIVHVIHHLVIGGMENGLVNLINLLPSSRYRHAIVCVEDFSDFRKRLRVPDVAVYALHKSRLTQWQLYWRLFSLFRKLRPAIVHGRNRSGLDGLLPALMSGIRLRVHGEHGWDVDDIDGKNRKLRNLRRLHRPFVSRYVCVSRHLQRYMIDRVGVSPENITQIYNGVDTGRFTPRTDGDRMPIVSKWNDARRFVLGTVGRLQPVKNQSSLLDAVGLLVGRYPHLRSEIGVAIIGEGPERDRLERQIEASGLQDIVELLGARDDIADLLPSFDVFVLPSLAEGISNTILEAMASGVPVIATRVGGNPELIQDGVTGRLVRIADSEAIAQCIFDYFSDPTSARRHGRAARQAVMQRFSLERMVGDYVSLYDNLLIRHTDSPVRAGVSS